ncbi:hypothetical protein HJC23_009012 [Cyclotella cryptica]|uniref:N-acetyltransferase domain-containing protein n=1 Tax=Cyclotella cryptica TaxID=29204 RepID=A0ABD3RA68_9STRA
MLLMVLMILSASGLITTVAFQANVINSSRTAYILHAAAYRNAFCSPLKMNAVSLNNNNYESMNFASSSTRFEKFKKDESTSSSHSLREHYRIDEAKYSQLSQVAEIITNSFHPELDNNPILRPLRVLLEMDRLQSNFPYGDKDHYYFVVSCCSEKDKDGIVVGFCDLDFRSPPTYSTNPFTMFTPSSSNHIIRQRPYLSDLAIHPGHRRRGLASSLMEEAENRAKSRGVREIYLGVAEENSAALSMYDGMGYEVLDYFNGGFRTDGLSSGVRLLRLEL